MTGNELVKISSACYNPILITNRRNIMEWMGVTDEQILRFHDSIDKKFTRFDIMRDPFMNTILFGMIYFAQQKKPQISKLFYTLLAVKFYGSMLHILFPKFCSEPLFKMALTQMSDKHLFRAKNGISNALIHVADSLFNMYEHALSKPDVSSVDIYRTVIDLRTRISQSCKSFAETYYKLQKDTDSARISSDDSVAEDRKDRDHLTPNAVANMIAIAICTYNQIDAISLDEAVTRSGLRRDLCTSVIEEITNDKYRAKLQFILILLMKCVNDDLKGVCSNRLVNTAIRDILGGKSFGKHVVKNTITDFLMDEIELGFRLKTVYPKQLAIMLSIYLYYFMRSRIC